MSGAARTLHPRRDAAAHQVERPGQLTSYVENSSRFPQPCGFALFLENLLAVVEGVERLRQAECVFRYDGELQISDGTVDCLIESRSFQDQAPQLIAVLAGQERLRGC